jgi:N-acetylmuramoyl-L-alanine amidase
MADVTSHGGHNAIIQGANWGSRKEHNMDRECNSLFISKLRALGHNVKNDTDDVGTTQSMIVNNQIRNINSRYNDVGFSWHLNASDTTGHGVEVLCYSEKEAPIARKISAEIAKRTGWKDRGAKLRPDLGVIRSTSCPVFLIEAGFIDNDSDMAKWNVENIVNAVIFAYFGQEAGNGSNNNGGAAKMWVAKTGGLGCPEAQEVMNKLAEFNVAGSLVYQGQGIFYLETKPVADRNRLGAIYWYCKDYRGWFTELYEV